MLAQKLVEMFRSELILKRFLVAALSKLDCHEPLTRPSDVLSWSDEVYTGEFGALRTCSLISKENNQPFYPGRKDSASSNAIIREPNSVLNREALQVYQIAWLSNVYIDIDRVEDIFRMVEDEMKCKLS